MDAAVISALWKRQDRFWFDEMPLSRLAAWRMIVCSVALYDVLLYSGLVLRDARLVDEGVSTSTWNPIYYMALLGAEPIGSELAHGVLLLTCTALVCGILGIASRAACLLGAALFFYWTGLAYSFGKPHHDKVVLAFALTFLWLAPVGARWSLDAWLRRKRGRPEGQNESQYAAFPLRMTQATLALTYCAAGLSKLYYGGLEWFNGYSLQAAMMGHDMELSMRASESVLLCQAQAVFVVSTQTLYPLVLLWPRARWYFLPAAALMHIGAWATMDTGPFVRVWILQLAFLPLERVAPTLRSWLRADGLARLRAIACIVLPVGAVTAALGIGHWHFALLLVPPLLWLATYLLRSPERRCTSS